MMVEAARPFGVVHWLTAVAPAEAPSLWQLFVPWILAGMTFGRLSWIVG